MRLDSSSEFVPRTYDMDRAEHDHGSYNGDEQYTCRFIIQPMYTRLRDITGSSLAVTGVSVKEGIFFDIITSSDGTIRFIGGDHGSSIVSKNKWKNNKNVLEDALGKAYEHPIREVYRPQSSSGPGG